MPYAVLVSALESEVLGSSALNVDELARSCGVEPAWVLDRVESGVLQVDLASGEWRFDSVTLLRARRLVALERTFDADPQLAALTADLIEEVARLKRRLRASGFDEL